MGANPIGRSGKLQGPAACPSNSLQRQRPQRADTASKYSTRARAERRVDPLSIKLWAMRCSSALIWSTSGVPRSDSRLVEAAERREAWVAHGFLARLEAGMVAARRIVGNRPRDIAETRHPKRFRHPRNPSPSQVTARNSSPLPIPFSAAQAIAWAWWCWIARGVLTRLSDLVAVIARVPVTGDRLGLRAAQSSENRRDSVRRLGETQRGEIPEVLAQS